MSPQLYQTLYGPDSLNHQLFVLLNHATNPVFDAIMPIFTWMGGSWAIYPYLALLLAISFINKEIMPRRYVWVYCIATVLAVLLEEITKAYFQVPRPAMAIGLEHVRVIGEVKLKNALPSGHAVFSFMTAYVLSHRRSWRGRGPLYSFAVIVAYQRIYVGAHYPLDVLAGGVVGVFSGFVVWKGWETVSGRNRPTLPQYK